MTVFRFATVILLVGMSAPAFATDASFVASGTGEVVAVPDIAYVKMNFVSEGKTPQEAADLDVKTSAAIIGALKGQGVEPRDLQTAAYTIKSVEGPDGCGNSYGGQPIVPCEITGYRIENGLTVRIRHLPSYPKILGAAIEAGLSDIGNMTLEVSDPQPYRDKAYAEALLAAKRKAELTAQTLGFKLGPITDVGANIVRSPGEENAPATLADGLAYEYPDGEADLIMLPIEAGELTFSRDASITYEIVQER